MNYIDFFSNHNALKKLILIQGTEITYYNENFKNERACTNNALENVLKFSRVQNV